MIINLIFLTLQHQIKSNGNKKHKTYNSKSPDFHKLGLFLPVILRFALNNSVR